MSVGKYSIKYFSSNGIKNNCFLKGDFLHDDDQRHDLMLCKCMLLHFKRYENKEKPHKVKKVICFKVIILMIILKRRMKQKYQNVGSYHAKLWQLLAM